MKVLQWNCRSIFSASVDLSCLAHQLNPDIILLQETWLSSGKNFHLQKYRAFRLDRPTRGGGLITFISTQVCHKAKIIFQLMEPQCEILVVELHLYRRDPLYIINTYFPHGVQDTVCLDRALIYCGRDILLAGDFNSHHVSWCLKTDFCGNRLWHWSLDKKLSCRNSGSSTFVRGHHRSTIDLTFTSSSLSLSSWSTVDSATNSDHLPVIFHISRKVTYAGEQSTIFVNYSIFKNSLKSAIASLSMASTEQKPQIICKALENSRKKSEFIIRTNKNTSFSPWWNDDCSRDYRKRKAAWKRLLYNQCPKNWSDYKFVRATFKRTISKAKEEYDKKHFDYLSKEKNKNALFRFLRRRKIIPRPNNIDSLTLSQEETQQMLKDIAEGLESRFSSLLSPSSRFHRSTDDFTEVTISELATAMGKIRNSAPGGDGITANMLKILFSEASDDLLAIVNHSLKWSWIPSNWKLAKIIPVLKDNGKGYTLDNIRPIALTSNLVKLIERIIYARMAKFIDDNDLLSPHQIGFRPGCSIWHAHVDLESRIKLARYRRQIAALVTLDISKAYDSVEYNILLHQLQSYNFPNYLVSWFHNFLNDREFYCSLKGHSSPYHRQSRGVPQGAVTSPLLFNVLLSSIPSHEGIYTYVYADDIAFFASDYDLHSLYNRLQAYMCAIEDWLKVIHLSLNVAKSSIIVFPLNDSVNITLTCNLQNIPQLDTVKYLGVIYDSHLLWRAHIDYIAKKGVRALGILHKISNSRSGMRRDTLIMIYKMYVRPVLEFGCVLYSGAPSYKLHALILLEREALRLCLGLPKSVATNALYLEARLPTLLCRFRLLTVQTFLRIYEYPVKLQLVFIHQPQLFFQSYWPRFRTPQVVYVQALIGPLDVRLYDVSPVGERDNLEIIFDNIYPSNARHLSQNIINGLLQNHLDDLHIKDVIATDASQIDEKSGIGIFSESFNWTFSLRLPDFLSVFFAEFLAVVMALRKLGSATSSVVIVTDSFSLCTALTTNSDSRILRTFHSLVPSHVTVIRLVWVPGHKGIIMNEMADSLARASLSGPIVPILPASALITAARFRRRAIRQEYSNSLLTNLNDYRHLLFPWNRNAFLSRKLEVTFTQLRCRIPKLNFYMHRAGLAPSPLCSHCGEDESIEHYFLRCTRLSSLRKHTEDSFHRVGLQFTATNILSLGASSLGHCHRDVCSTVSKFLIDSGRFFS